MSKYINEKHVGNASHKFTVPFQHGRMPQRGWSRQSAAFLRFNRFCIRFRRFFRDLDIKWGIELARHSNSVHHLRRGQRGHGRVPSESSHWLTCLTWHYGLTRPLNHPCC